MISVYLARVELMDYLDSIDCSLEDFQAMLYGKQFGIDFDALEVKLYHIIIKTSKTQKFLFISTLSKLTQNTLSMIV